MENESLEMWVEREFGGLELGDMRRVARLMKIVAGKATNPDVGMSMCLGKSASMSASRLFKNEKVNFDSVLACHKEQTRKRCLAYDLVYAVQDTTDIDLRTHKSLSGLGRISYSKGEDGLNAHSVLAVSPDKTPLGVIDVNIWSRDVESYGKRKTCAKRAIEEKESYKWIRGKRSTESLLVDCRRVVLVGDRESDMFELFSQPRSKNLDLLIRVAHDRCIDGDGKLFDEMKKASVAGEFKLRIPRQKDEAIIDVSFGTVDISSQKEKRKKTPLSISLNWVRALQRKPPEGKKAIEWKLLTTLQVNNFDDAKKCIDGYSNRWIIEEYHKTLKSGCKIEGLQFETLDSILPAMAVCFVISWRLLHLSKFFRNRPDEDANLIGSELEIKVLSGWLKSRKEKNWRIKTVKDFVIGVAKLGCYLGRKNDGHPGTKPLWLGIRRLEDLVSGYVLASQIG